VGREESKGSPEPGKRIGPERSMPGQDRVAPEEKKQVVGYASCAVFFRKETQQVSYNREEIYGLSISDTS